MGMTYVVSTHDAWQFTRSLENNMIIEHLDLNLSTLDAVIAMTYGIDNHLLNHELGVHRAG